MTTQNSMRTLKQTGQFKRDFKRESKGQYRQVLEKEFLPIVEKLANDDPLPDRYHDHALINDWKDYRDCHIKPDLILIYRKLDEATLELVRLGSHSELGL